MFYLLFYALGVIVAILSPMDSVKEGLAVLEPITLTALFASLLVAFAGFNKTEKWHKFVLQYGLTPLFGMYTVVLWEKSSWAGMFLLCCASGTHFAFWLSSIQSRQYRLDQFRLGFAARMPATAELIAMLNGQGRSHESDAVITRILKGKPDREHIKQLFGVLSSPELRVRASREIDNAGAISDNERFWF